MTATSVVTGPSHLGVTTSPASDATDATSAAPLLPDPCPASLDGASIEQLAALLTRADAQDRKEARHLAQTADNAAMNDDNQEVQAMRHKADNDRDAAVWSGAGDIAAGTLTFVSAFVPAPPTGAQTHADWHTALDAGTKGSVGVSTIVSAGCKVSGEQDDATAAKYGAAAQANVRRYNEAHDDAQAASDSIQKVEQFLDQIEQTRNASRLTAAAYRA